MDLYPRAKGDDGDGRWGGQTFSPEADGSAYVPVPLDSLDAARTRMIESILAGADGPTAKAAALKGSDEIGTVDQLYKEIEAEAAAMDAIPVVADEVAYKAALDRVAVHLDAARFVADRKASLGGTLAPVAEGELPELP